MQRGDQAQAEAAIVALSRGQGARPTLEQLWQYGCRNGGTGGQGFGGGGFGGGGGGGFGGGGFGGF